MERYINFLAKQLATEFFAMELDVPIVIVEELGYFGQCFPAFDGEGYLIDMSHIAFDKKLIDLYPERIVKGVLLHELCHWSLFRRGLPSDDHDIEFIAEMERVGGLFPNDIPLTGDFHVFRCKKCYKEAGMFQLSEDLNALKAESRKFVCSRCGSKIRYFGIETVNQLEDPNYV